MQVQLHGASLPELAASTGGSSRGQPPAGEAEEEHSNPSGECVEIAPLPTRSVAVRDSKYPDSAVLVFTRAEWDTFLADVRGWDGCRM